MILKSFREKVQLRYAQASSDELVLVEVLGATGKILSFAADNMGYKTTMRLEDAARFATMSAAKSAQAIFEKNWNDTSSSFEIRTVGDVTPKSTKEDWRDPPGIFYFNQPK